MLIIAATVCPMSPRWIVASQIHVHLRDRIQTPPQSRNAAPLCEEAWGVAWRYQRVRRIFKSHFISYQTGHLAFWEVSHIQNLIYEDDVGKNVILFVYLHVHRGLCLLSFADTWCSVKNVQMETVYRTQLWRCRAVQAALNKCGNKTNSICGSLPRFYFRVHRESV